MAFSFSPQVSEQVQASHWMAAVKQITQLIEEQGNMPTSRQARVLAFLCGWEHPLAEKRLGGAALINELKGNFATLAYLQHDHALGDQASDFQAARQQLLTWVGANWAESWGVSPKVGHTPWDSTIAPILAGIRRALTPSKAESDSAMNTADKLILGRLVDLVDEEIQYVIERQPRAVAPLGQRRNPAPGDLLSLLAGVEKGRYKYAQEGRSLPDFSVVDTEENIQAGLTDDDHWSPSVNQWAALWAQASLGILSNTSVVNQNHIAQITGAWMAAGYHEGLDEVPVIWRTIQSDAISHKRATPTEPTSGPRRH
jgi:hypothetical protein